MTTTGAWTLSTYGRYVRFPIGNRPPACRLDAVAGQRCRLVVLDQRTGQERTVFDVPIARISQVRLRVGQLTLVIEGRKYDMQLATPDEAARLGARVMAVGAAAGNPGLSLAGSVAGMAAGHRRNKQVDPEGLRCLRFFASHGIPVEGGKPWKSELRYALMGVPILFTAVAVLGSLAGVAEGGGWNDQTRSGVLGAVVLTLLCWLLYAGVIALLWRTVPRDTAERL